MAPSGTASPMLGQSPSLRPTHGGLLPDALHVTSDAIGSSAASAAGTDGSQQSMTPVGMNGSSPSPSPSSGSAQTPLSTPLDANLPKILDNLNQARQFETPDVSEPDLVIMIRKLLLQYGSVPVGKLGSLLHNHMQNHSLPSMLKERYGGLKKLIERHTDSFIIGTDHPFNPSTHLSPAALLLAQKEAEEAALAEHQAQLAAMAATGHMPGGHGPMHGHSNSGGYASGQHGYGSHSGGGRSSGHYPGGGRGPNSQRNAPQQAAYQNHHNQAGGNNQHYQHHAHHQQPFGQQKQHAGGVRYAQPNSNALAGGQHQPHQQQHHHHIPANVHHPYAAHPTYPVHHHSGPTSPPQSQIGIAHSNGPPGYAPHAHGHHPGGVQRGAGGGPYQDAGMTNMPYPTGDTYQSDFPTLNQHSVMKQHR